MSVGAAAARTPTRTGDAGRNRLADWLGPRTLVIGAAFTFAFGVLIRPMYDPDFPWHIATGQWILAHHALPSRDLYTFTVATHSWLDHEWLSEVLMWLGYRAGGTALLSIAFAIVALTGLLCLFLAAEGPRRPQLVAAAGLVMGVTAGLPVWGPRTQVITFALSCVVVLWTQRFLAGRSQALWLLPPLMALWANLHSGFVIAFVFLGVACVCEALHWAVVRRAGDGTSRLHARRVWQLLLILVAGGIAALATPNGWKLWLYPLQTQGSGVQQQLIAEWSSPDFHAFYMWPLGLMVLAVVAGFAVKRPSLHQLLICLVTLAMTLESSRHMVFFVAAATPVLIECWSAGWQRVFGPNNSIAGPARSRMPAAVNGALLLVLATVVAVYGSAVQARQGEVSRQAYPVAATDWLLAHPQYGHRIFNEYVYGGYQAYRLPGARRIAIFGEAAVMGDEFLWRYHDITQLGAGWSAKLESLHPDAVMVARTTPLAGALDGRPGWRLVYSDQQAVVFLNESG